MFRREVGFDSFLIICEILALQFCFYSVYYLMVWFLDFTMRVPFSEEQILNSEVADIWTGTGRIVILGQLGGGLAAAFLFVVLDGRPRKAPDFITTTFAVHLLLVSLHMEFPTALIWWLSFFLCWILSMHRAFSLSMHHEVQEMMAPAIYAP